MTSPIDELRAYLEQHKLHRKTIGLKRGEHLHLAGDCDTNVYQILSGSLRSYTLIDGEEQTIRFGYAGDFFAAIDSYISDGPSILSTQALRKCRLRLIPKPIFQDRLENDRSLAGTWQHIMSWMILGQLEREIDLLTNDPAERYRRILQRSPRLFQEVPAKYIANYLRMTPETLSRIGNK